MRHLTFLSLLLVPALANAHPGHGAEAGFLAGVVHPFTGVDHVLAIVLAGLLLGGLPEKRQWIACAAFLGVSGATHVLWTADPVSGGYVAGLLLVTAGLVAAGMAATKRVRFTASARR